MKNLRKSTPDLPSVFLDRLQYFENKTTFQFFLVFIFIISPYWFNIPENSGIRLNGWLLYYFELATLCYLSLRRNRKLARIKKRRQRIYGYKEWLTGQNELILYLETVAGRLNKLNWLFGFIYLGYLLYIAGSRMLMAYI